jgi:hypothetical protein
MMREVSPYRAQGRWVSGSCAMLIRAEFPVRVWNSTSDTAAVLSADCPHHASLVRPRVGPIFRILGHRTRWLDHIGDGSRLALALNRRVR